MHFQRQMNGYPTRMHSSRMRTARSSSLREGSPPGTPPTRHTPRDQAPPPLNRMTNRCKNTTLPETSFAGGKNYYKASRGGGGEKGIFKSLKPSLMRYGHQWVKSIFLCKTSQKLPTVIDIIICQNYVGSGRLIGNTVGRPCDVTIDFCLPFL